ncbi:MAG: peptidylprolyl isomerase, partial [Ruminococcus sp.]|nr:peptidylprolyl isomerase [Ruminococcus sp.]
MKLNKIITMALSLSLLATMTACGNEKADETAGENGGTTVANQKIEEDLQSDGGVPKESAAMPEQSEYLNFTQPEKGEEIAVIHVKDYGDIKIKLFPELVPKAVENFTTHAKDSYYKGLIFHRVIPEFMIQGGDPLGTGMGGESIWGSKFDGGISSKLRHFTGALAYANSGSTSTNGSQFYIVTENPLTNETFPKTKADGKTEYKCPQNVKDEYIAKGGAPFLDGDYTVFGQVFEGQNIVNAISQVPTIAPQVQDKPI